MDYFYVFIVFLLFAFVFLIYLNANLKFKERVELYINFILNKNLGIGFIFFYLS